MEIKKLDNRILILEIANENTKEQIKELKNDTKVLKEGLAAINDSIKQVRNVVIGIAIAFVLLNSGVLQSIKIALSAGL